MPARRPSASSLSGHLARPAWRLEEAKARFSEVVRLAREVGPQHVTVRGRDAVVVLSAEDYARLAPAAAAPSLAVLFGTGPFTRLDSFDADASRERPPVRDAVRF
jgi:prevent-host-death family protein